ncbi:MAG TPA: Hsp20/alpha crystallin family protein [Tepidisphaeraceae bacterium]|jgi:HSP20 family protein
MSVETVTEQPFKRATLAVNKMMEQMQKGYYNFCPSETWTPNVNLYETEGNYLICVDLAGVDKEKIDVEVAHQTVTLRGHRSVPAHDEGEVPEIAGGKLRVHLMEIDHGAFSREVELPEDIERDKIVATYRSGMLWVALPKK